MDVDFDKIFQDAIAAAQGKLTTGAPEVKAYVEKVLNDHEDDLKAIVTMRVRGTLTPEQFSSELDDEKTLMVQELKLAQTIALKVAQDAANAAIDVLTTAVTKAIGAAV
jgi:hypothetical protein